MLTPRHLPGNLSFREGLASRLGAKSDWLLLQQMLS